MTTTTGAVASPIATVASPRLAAHTIPALWRRLLGLAALSGTLSLTLPLGAQAVVKDINTTPPTVAGSDPGGRWGMLTVGSTTFLDAFSSAFGSGLWKTDGTAAGTVLVKDVTSITARPDPKHLTAFNGAVYFSAYSRALGTELWRTDGTTSGTLLVADCYPGPATGHPQDLIVVGSTLFFSAEDSMGRELWRTDGTTAGTMRVTDLAPGAGDGVLDTAAFAPFGAGLLFSGTNGSTVNGEELWYTNGTTAGTVMVKDIWPGSSSSAPRFLTPFGGRVYFLATDGEMVLPGSGVELWVTDGTTAGTTLVKDILPGILGSSPSALVVSAGKMCFSANDGTNGRELWVSDGTTAGTRLVTNLGAGSSIASQTDNVIVPFATGVLFGASNGTTGSGTGEELWFSDGTAAGTRQVADIHAGTASSSPRAARVVGSRVFFAATTAATGYEMFVTDGTTAGTRLTLDIFAGANSGVGPQVGAIVVPSAALGSSLLFAGNTGTVLPGTGMELWISDGTAGGTRLVKDISPPIPASSDPVSFTSLGNLTVFAASDGVNFREPWVTDGTAAGTVQLKDINPGRASNLSEFTVFGNKVYFRAGDTSTTGLGDELWVTDGTPAGTMLVRDINPGAAGSDPTAPVVAQGRLWFTAMTAAAGRELWTSDGTAAGTAMVIDLNPGTADGTVSYRSIVPFGSGVIFSGRSASTGLEICVSDGTPAGTRVLDFSPGTTASDPSPAIAFGGFVYFGAYNSLRGRELTRTDGTLAGTALVKDINPGAASGDASGFAILNNRLYFFATSATEGRELWMSDGTNAGTVLVKDIYPGPDYSVTGQRITVAHDRMFFVADDGTSGQELWISDGTGVGTIMTRDLNPGRLDGAVPSSLAPAGLGRRVLFAGHDGATGFEPCVSDGTPAGTRVLADFYPGPGSSSPSGFMANSASAAIYLGATDVTAGRELVRMSPATVGAALADVFGVGCAGGNGVPRIGMTGVPQIGSTYTVTLDNGPPTTWCLLYLHAARQDLPLNASCTSYVLQPAFDVWAPTNALGSGSIGIPVPAVPHFVGLELWQQWVTIGPGGSFLGLLAYTPGLHVVLGAP